MPVSAALAISAEGCAHRPGCVVQEERFPASQIADFRTGIVVAALLGTEAIGIRKTDAAVAVLVRRTWRLDLPGSLEAVPGVTAVIPAAITDATSP